MLVVQVIEDTVGKPIYEIFSDFDHLPIGAASIGQVGGRAFGSAALALTCATLSLSSGRRRATSCRQRAAAWPCMIPCRRLPSHRCITRT